MRESGKIRGRSIYRVIDANLNRAVEGARVCEEMARFILRDKKLTLEYKTARHNIVGAFKALRIDSRLLLESRDSDKDAKAVKKNNP